MYSLKQVNETLEDAYGTTASEFTETIPKGVTAHALMIVMQFLQNGANIPTLSDVLTQLGSEIELAVGNKVMMKLSPTDLHEYLTRQMGIHSIVPINDGTGADNQIMELRFPVPLAPIIKDSKRLMHPEYGLDGSKDVAFKLTYPADGNKIDNRKFTLYAISIDGATPRKIVEIEENTVTFTGTGTGQRLTLSQRTEKKLREIMFKQTSYLGEGLTADAMTIEEIAYQEANEDVLFFDIPIRHLPELLEGTSGSAITMLHDDQYPIVRFYDESDPYSVKQLTDSSSLVVKVGVAEAVTYWQFREVPLSFY